MINHSWFMTLSMGLLLALGDYSIYAQDGHVDGVSSAETRKISITGRKMLGQLVSRNKIKRKEWMKGESPFVISSEEGNEASKKYLEGSTIDQLNDQPTHKEDQTRAIPAFPTSSDNEQVSDKANDTTQEDETKRLLEATKELVSMMQEDYRRYARRKPPINNHEPYH